MALTNQNESLQSILDTLKQKQKVASDYNAPAHTGVATPEIRSAQELAKLLGVDFTTDKNAIQQAYQDATSAAYQRALEGSTDAQKNYYANVAATQDTAIGTLRNQYAQAIASGASKGMQAANALSAVLGLSQQTAQQATQLATDRQALGTQYAQMLKDDVKNAIQASNEIGTGIAGIAHQLYNDDIQRKTAELSYNQGINTDQAGLAANKYTADTNLAGNVTNASAGIYNNNQSAIAALEAAIHQAAATRYAAEQGRYQNLHYSGGYAVTGR